VAGIKSFPGLPHRQELIATIGDVSYINDSKATNADATAKALACYQPIYWILGGRAKETGLDGLEPFYPRIAHAFLIGEASERFAASLEGHVAYSKCGTLAAAVAAAHRLAQAERKPGAVVLLSPACASFDQFANFEERGNVFRQLVQALFVTPANTGGGAARGAAARWPFPAPTRASCPAGGGRWTAGCWRRSASCSSAASSSCWRRARPSPSASASIASISRATISC